MTKNLSYLLLLAIVLNACSNTKYLPKGEKLYTGGQVKIVDKDIKKGDSKALTTELEALLRPKPNGSFLGLRPKLYLWNITQTPKTKGFRAWLHRKGEPPVFASDVDLDKNSQILTNRLQNVSYFQAQVSGDTVSKGRTAKAVYTANTGPAYKIRKVVFPTSPEGVDTAVAGTAKESLLKVGDNYNLDVIKNERIRIDARLKEKGFFYFAPDDIKLRVDSTIDGHQVDMFVKVKEETPQLARTIYFIRNIYVYPNYTLRDTALKLDSAKKYRWYYMVQGKRETVKPWLFKNTVLLQPGEVYNRTDHTKSLNRFVELGPFKFVKNRFEDVTPDSPLLDVYYQLTQYPRKSIQFDLLGRTTSASYNGVQASISWKNRNAFKGGELLTVSLIGSTDGQVGQSNGGYAVSQIGVQTSLSWPRFVSPFNFKADNAYIPHTTLTLGGSLVVRSQLYTLDSYNGAFGYQWKQDQYRQHTLNLLEVTYTHPRSVTALYLDSIAKTGNPTLAHVIAPQFTWGPSYSFTYDNTIDAYRTNTFLYSGKISLSNNIYGLITGANIKDGKPQTLFGLPFDQYVKLENEIRYFHKLGPNSKIATRFTTGLGLAYGNSLNLPYSQQFYAGGANSLRGFRARSVGPGTVDPYHFVGASGFLPDESGDIKLEANVEYRAKLFSIVNGALFVDAGNVWNINHQALPTGGTTASTPALGDDAFGKYFYKQLAADIGFGLRFDLTVLILRTDYGIPVLRPWQAGSNWVTPKLGNGIFNLAIGYPF
jgi:outer membrane protein insertion porin family